MLPFLKEGDSYQTQRESPSVGFLLLAPLERGAPQAIRASPAIEYSTILVFPRKTLDIVAAKTV
jgi:hypothetical protein